MVSGDCEGLHSSALTKNGRLLQLLFFLIISVVGCTHPQSFQIQVKLTPGVGMNHLFPEDLLQRSCNVKSKI